MQNIEIKAPQKNIHVLLFYLLPSHALLTRNTYKLMSVMYVAKKITVRVWFAVIPEVTRTSG